MKEKLNKLKPKLEKELRKGDCLTLTRDKSNLVQEPAMSEFMI